MSTATAANNNPFPGLRPFKEDEEYRFFGRENQVDAMVDKLTATRFLAVVGTSGSGKSSLVNCGLRPALHGGLMARAGTAWRMAQFRPGSDPMRAMARALAKDGVLFRDYQAGGLTLAEIVDTTLRMSNLGLIDIYEQAQLGDGVNLLVVVDQFEELFRYRQFGAGHEDNVYGMSEEAAAFVNLLLEAKAQTTHPIYVVLTMRSDFLGDCTQFTGLAEAINAGQYLVPRMTRDERRAAISGPVGVGGAEISPVLLTRLVNDVGDNPDQLSILQHALNRTWNQWERSGASGPLDLPHYQSIGTMAHALDQHAERAYAELTTARQQQICEKVFKALTDKATDPRGVRRPTTLGTLCALAEATAAEVTEVIDVFRKPSRSFLMPPAEETLEAETVIDISHESLMRVWERLKTWADEEAQSAHIYRRLAETAALHGEGKAGLWSDPDLQVALDWKEKNQPNKEWARRYNPHFERAIDFLQASEKKRAAAEAERQRQQNAEVERAQRELQQAQALVEAQQQRAEAERQKVEEQRERLNQQARAASRMRRLMAALAVVALLALGSTVFAFTAYKRAENERKNADAATTKAIAAESKAVTEKDNVDTQRKAAEVAQHQAEIDKADAEHANKLAAVRAVEAGEQRKLALASATKAETERQNAERERDTARGLEKEKQEQATTNGYFKTAFDKLASAKYVAAAYSLQDALNYFKEKGKTPDILSTHINIGDVYREANRVGAAMPRGVIAQHESLKSYDSAIELIESGAGDGPLLVATLEKAASVGAESDSLDGRRESADYYKRAAAVYRKLGNKEYEADRFIDAGIVFSRSDDPESIAFAQENFNLAVQVYADDKNKMAETNEDVAEHYERTVEKESKEDKKADDAESDQADETSPESKKVAATRRQQERVLHENRLRSTAADYFLAAANIYAGVSASESAAKMLKAGAILGQSKTLELKEKAVAVFSAAADKFKAADAKQEQTEALISAGDVFREADNRELWPRADSYYELAVRVYRDAGLKKEEAETLSSIALSYGLSLDPGQKRRAVDYYQRAATVSGATKNQPAEVSALLNAAGVLVNLEDKEAQLQATALYDRAVAVYENDSRKQVATLVRIGSSLFRADDEARTAKAETYFEQALALGEKKSGKKGAASAYMVIGAAYQSQRQFSKAIANFEISRTLYQELKEPYGLGMALYRLAAIYEPNKAKATPLADQSLELLAQALPGIESSGDKKDLADGHYAMGYLYQRIKRDNVKALASYVSAYALYKTMPDQSGRVLNMERSIPGLRKAVKPNP
ncbi:MAG: hypothetical protein ACREA9_10985 [Pyrinomonadaceae bacterium]